MIASREFTATVPVCPARAAGRFTLDGDAAMEAALDGACSRVLSGVRGLIPERRLEALLLGGGYGRGEGGVLRTPDGQQPYNDLEFYVAIAGPRLANELRYQPGLRALGHILAHQTGVEIEFKVTSLRRLASAPPDMFRYDLMAGHRLLWGRDAALAGCHRHAVPENIPVREATRLLMNRATGLLLARRELERSRWTEEAADFVRRNVAKAQLACGDAILTVCGLYHWSCRMRGRRLERLLDAMKDQLLGDANGGAVPAASGAGSLLAAPDEPCAADSPFPPIAWLARVAAHHAAGIEFKLHPTVGPAERETLARQHAVVAAFTLQTWLWVESTRLNRTFLSPRAYAEDHGDKWPDESGLRCALLNLRATRRLGRNPLRHPRGRALNALAMLLWDRPALKEPDVLQRVQRDLATRAADYPALLDAYLHLWRRVQ